MAKRKQTATQRLRKLIQQQVRRMEKRGYRIDTELKEKIKTGKYQTLQSIRKNKYAKLYEGASAEIDSKIVSGKRYRQYERKVSAEKAVETRRENAVRRRVERKAKEAYERGYREAIDRASDEVSGYEETELPDVPERRSQDYYDEDYESEWEEQHRNYEEQEWEEARRQQDSQDRQLAESIQQGSVMYDNIADLIDKFPRAGADILQKALASEINKYGLDLVMAGMAQSPINVVEEAQKIVHYNGTKENIHRSITSLFDSITGTIRTIQDSMTIGDVMDKMTDMSEL